jgi:transcriptional regulator with XRE-family HTH domain
MTTSRSLMPIADADLLSEADDMFSDLPPLGGLEVKQLQLSTQLTALMVHCDETRTTLAHKLDWKKSRLTHIFSGRANPTVRTIYEFTRCLGVEFDVVFRRPEEPAPRQPWEDADTQLLQVASHESYTLMIQSADQVARDLQQGLAKGFYIPLDLNTPAQEKQRVADSSTVLDGYVTEGTSFKTSNFTYTNS